MYSSSGTTYLQRRMARDAPNVLQRQREAGKHGAEFGHLGGRGNKKPLGVNLPQGVSDKERAPRPRDKAAAMVGVAAPFFFRVEVPTAAPMQ